MPDSSLKQLGKYELTDVLGEGAMGVVYRAFDPVLNRTLAVKVMNTSIAADAALRERFLREARAAGSLQHPNVITVYDFGEADGHLFIAMEFIDGADLAEVMKGWEVIPIAVRLDIVIDALNGLAYAHSRGLVHRDVKPANIRVTAENRAKIMDFGIARLQSSELTQTGMLLGTPQYMAPEQVTGGPITPASDVFAVGTLMYEFLTGVKPFQGETLHEVMYKVMHEAPRPARQIAPRLPAAIDTILLKALAKDPADRYQTAAAMAKDLTAARLAITGAEQPAGSPQTETTEEFRSHVTTAIRDPRLQEYIRRPSAVVREKRRMRIPWMVTGGVVVVATLVIVMMARRGGESNTTSPIVTPPQKAAEARPDPAPPSAAPVTQPQVVAKNPGPPASRDVPARIRETSRGAPPSAVAPPQNATVSPSSAQADSMVRAMRGAAMASRRRAQDAGAAAADLAAGDSLLSAADALIERGKGTDAALQITAAVDRWAGAERAARDRAAQAQSAPPQRAVTPPPVTSPATPPVTPPVEAVPKAPPDPRPEIERVIATYAQAIESGSVAEIRRAYPGLTGAQQQNWEAFFKSVRNFKATLTISQLGASGNTAIAEIDAAYQYENKTTGRAERQQLHVQAGLNRESGAWRLVTVR